MNVVYRSVLDEVAEAKARASIDGRIIDRIEVSPEELKALKREAEQAGVPRPDARDDMLAAEALKREAEQAGVPVEEELGSYRTVLGVRVVPVQDFTSWVKVLAQFPPYD